MTPAHQYQLFGTQNLNVKVAPGAFFVRYITTQMQLSFVFLTILFDKKPTFNQMPLGSLNWPTLSLMRDDSRFIFLSSRPRESVFEFSQTTVTHNFN